MLFLTIHLHQNIFFAYKYFVSIRCKEKKYHDVSYSTLYFLKFCFYTFFCTKHRRGAKKSTRRHPKKVTRRMDIFDILRCNRYIHTRLWLNVPCINSLSLLHLFHCMKIFVPTLSNEDVSLRNAHFRCIIIIVTIDNIIILQISEHVLFLISFLFDMLETY